jgi:hypothetical protein
MHEKARYGLTELRTYHEGYYFGVVYALRCAVEAVRNFDRVEKCRRVARRQKRSA